MNLTNEDKLKRDATSLLKAGWDVERITRHLVTNPADYGTGLHHDGVRPIIVGVLDELNREVRKRTPRPARSPPMSARSSAPPPPTWPAANRR